MDAVVRKVARAAIWCLTLGAGNVWQAGDAFSKSSGRPPRWRQDDRQKAPAHPGQRLSCATAPSRSRCAWCWPPASMHPQRFEQFLIRDPRFFLAGPADYGQESPNISTEWRALRLARAGAARLRRGLRPQRLPASAGRAPQSAARVSWVHDASIARIWPDRLMVAGHGAKAGCLRQIAGRRHRALGADRRRGRDSRSAGASAPFQLPVLSGVPTGETSEQPRHTRAAHAAADERAGSAWPTTCPKWMSAIWTT